MVQPSGELRLADETVARERLCNLIAQDLDGDVAAMPKIACEIDSGHPAAAKLALNVVLARQRSLELAVRRGKAHAWQKDIEANIGLERVVTTCHRAKGSAPSVLRRPRTSTTAAMPRNVNQTAVFCD